MVVEIDGSVFEGGGQILRSAVAFGAVLGKAVVVKKIRAKRKTPGLRPQHLHGILAVKELTSAHVKGTHIGSNRIEFIPQNRKGGKFTVDIGTAGAITLVLQGVMIVAPYCERPVRGKLTGGTNVAWSPPIEYLQHVILPRLQQMNYQGMVEIEKRGYYPRGGGRINTNLLPVNKLASLSLKEAQEAPKIFGISHCGSLPRHVAERQANAATNTLVQAGYQIETIDIKHSSDTLSPGSGVSLWTSKQENRIIGADALGQRKLKAEVVGEQAAASLIQELKTSAPVDVHQADMIIPYIALAEGESSFSVSELAMHTITNIHVVEQFLDIRFDVKGELGTPAHISVKGIGFAGSGASPEPSQID
ncbi:MAG: RNA 3'-terminal phosphate cyclase [Candidatus Hermodarchaeia archaeon]|jgi:RNA 3'-phosphate cyclase